jgi:hypothetical protein
VDDARIRSAAASAALLARLGLAPRYIAMLQELGRPHGLLPHEVAARS